MKREDLLEWRYRLRLKELISGYQGRNGLSNMEYIAAIYGLGFGIASTEVRTKSLFRLPIWEECICKYMQF